jgi:hypothetical protein
MIGLGIRLGLAAGRAGGGGILTPVYMGFGSSSSGNPTLPTHSAGQLLVAIGTDGSASTIPTVDQTGGIWPNNPVAQAHPGTGQAIAMYWMYATASNHTVTWTNATNMRAVWVFSNASVDATGVTTSTGTALDIAALSMVATSCLVLQFVVCISAQTSFATSVVTPTGLTQRAQKLTSAACWAGDSDTTRMSSYNPAAGTLDTTSAKTMALAVSIKGTGA